MNNVPEYIDTPVAEGDLIANKGRDGFLPQAEESTNTCLKPYANSRIGLLNEMSMANSELVNMQRMLIKQNGEISSLNTKLQSTNAELEKFTYVASHDLKEPLRMVISFMGLLKSKYGQQLDEKAHSYIDFALDGGKRMQKMIGDLLELSRIGRNNIMKESADFTDILSEVKRNLSKLIEDTSPEIIVKTTMPVLPVYKGDCTRLLQNLLSNAIKFRKGGGNPIIQVSAIEKEDEWLFSIEDNGIGIEPEHIEKVFEIFARLHSQEEYEGAGIGLAICKKIVEQHGGKIWLKSEEGKGSVFYFTLLK